MSAESQTDCDPAAARPHSLSAVGSGADVIAAVLAEACAGSPKRPQDRAKTHRREQDVDEREEPVWQ